MHLDVLEVEEVTHDALIVDPTGDTFPDGHGVG